MSSPTHYKVKAKAIKRILDSPTIVIMSADLLKVCILSLPLRALAASVLVMEQERRERSGASTSPDILPHSLQISGKLFWVYKYKSLKDLPLSEI